MTDLRELDTESAVYAIESFEGPYPQQVPARAKSMFAEDYDIPYSRCRAQVVDYGDEQFVVVGEVNDDY